MVTLKHKKKETLENVIRIRGRGDLLICIVGYLQGYFRGITGEHRAIKWACRAAFMMIVFAVALVVVSFAPNVWKFPKDSETIVSVAKAAEEDTGVDPPEETEENADKLEEKASENTVEETESKPEPLDDSNMVPTDQNIRCRIGTVSGIPLAFDIAIKNIDITPPQITSLIVDDYEISTVDQTVPVTVTIKAVDEVTPTCKLEYAFLPAGVDPFISLRSRSRPRKIFTRSRFSGISTGSNREVSIGIPP